MLKNFLTNLRKQKCIGSQKALKQVGAGWTASGDASIKKEFAFNDFKEASNFMMRYSEFCQKTGATP